MSSMTDPNQLAPLTELANQILQDRIRKDKLPEFATSSRWAASAIVLELAESMGFHARVGFELRTPLGEPFQDVIVGWGPNRDDAVRNTVTEWLDLALTPARAVHSDKDTHARLGETQIGDVLYAWRMAAGPLRITGPDADEATAELSKSDLFTRLNMAAALPLQKEAPWLCLKLHMARNEQRAVTCTAQINNTDWPAGRELLQRFVLPGFRPLDLRQYLFLRRTAKRAAAPTPAVTRPASPAPGSAAKKPWWKVW